MSEIAVKVDRVGKKFFIGHKKEGDLRTSLVKKFKHLLGGQSVTEEAFWALKDISFEIKKGEAVGIIGRNGAGKSTLLKILSRITDPSMGRFEINGRVSSLLEVGTGFHQELTGRENIYLNGTILGMRRAEIKSKFDEIIAFSGVEKFIDTPVKHYSSGMKVRLAFSVAAHLEPEILIIDEVLAVGDAEFQKKCLGKMDEVKNREGRTVLFVSHNMSAVKSLCNKGILLSSGTVELIDETDIVVNAYQKDLLESTTHTANGSGEIKLKAFKITNSLGAEIDTFNTFDSVTFHLRYQSFTHLKNVAFAICLNNASGQRVTSLWTSFKNIKYDISPGETNLEIQVPRISIFPGFYEVIVYVEANGIAIERLDNFRNIIIGFDTSQDYIQLPSEAHGVYMEDFLIKKYD
jgi:lipopolysaccharide transport system ATP-binding protein